VTGSIGVLIRAVENDRITEPEAENWLERWVDETNYRAPLRDLSEYRRPVYRNACSSSTYCSGRSSTTQ